MQLQPYTFNKPVSRPFVFASFVSTLDGKIIVKEPGYWPIGSQNDYQFFTHIRAHADVIIDGKNTAQMFGKKTVETITSSSFKEIRSSLGKEKDTEYVVVTSKPDEELIRVFNGEYKPYIATTHAADTRVYDQSRVISIEGEHQVDLKKLMDECEKKGWNYVFIDGGPTLIAGLLAHGLLDELFITLAPKIFGSKESVTMTLAEGQLFSPENIKQFKLISSETVGDEIFLRYRAI